MKGNSLLTLIFLLSGFSYGDSLVDYDATKAKPLSESSESIRLEILPAESLESSSLISFNIGRAALSGLSFNNEYYSFDYSGADSLALQMGVETTPLNFYGRWGVRADIGYQSYSQSQNLPKVGEANYTLHLIGASLGGVYLMDYPKVRKWVVGSISVGAAYLPFFQSGEPDGVQASGNRWAVYTVFGLRHRLSWMGLKETLLTVDYRLNSQLGDSSDIDLSGESLLLGFATEL